MSRNELINKAIELCKTVNPLAEENRHLFEMCTDAELKEYIHDIETNGFRTSIEKVAERETARALRMEGDTRAYSSSTNGDYGPSNPWDAPGMSVSDFV